MLQASTLLASYVVLIPFTIFLFIDAQWILNTDEDFATAKILLVASGFVIMLNTILQDTMITRVLWVASFSIWEDTREGFFMRFRAVCCQLRSRA